MIMVLIDLIIPNAVDQPAAPSFPREPARLVLVDPVGTIVWRGHPTEIVGERDRGVAHQGS